MLHLCMNKRRNGWDALSVSEKKGVISKYLFDEGRKSELKVLEFDSYSEEWLDFILNCRSGRDTSDYDLVIGGVANDKVFNTVECFLMD